MGRSLAVLINCELSAAAAGITIGTGIFLIEQRKMFCGGLRIYVNVFLAFLPFHLL